MKKFGCCKLKGSTRTGDLHLFSDSCCRTVRGAEVQLLLFHFFRRRGHIQQNRWLIWSGTRPLAVLAALLNNSLCLFSHLLMMWGQSPEASNQSWACLQYVTLQGCTAAWVLPGLNSPHYLLSEALWLLPKANWFTPGRLGACTVIAARKRMD